MVIAAKCAPEPEILSAIHGAGLKAVEIYTDSSWLERPADVIRVCREFPLRYAVHAPTDGSLPEAMIEVAAGVEAEVVVFHDVFWEDEWPRIAESFSGLKATLCVENIASGNEPLKLIRRFNMGLCLDLEHLQMQVGGVFEETFLRTMKGATHVHMSGYTFGSEMWHSHIHHSPLHSGYLLGLLKRAGYSGMVVSEARVDQQTLAEFRELASFAGEQLGDESQQGKVEKRGIGFCPH
jgi:sugar phosphate isomerase/epimerase